jgi:hypothetical protein
MGIRDKSTAPASPWQNGFAERLTGSIRRECVDHIIVLGEAHLRRILKTYAEYYNRCQNASIPEQGCARFSPGSAHRCDQFTRHPGRTSSPLRPCLSFRYTPAEIIEAIARTASHSRRYHALSRRTAAGTPRARMVAGSAAVVARTAPRGSCSTVAIWPKTRRVSSTISPLANSSAS